MNSIYTSLNIASGIIRGFSASGGEEISSYTIGGLKIDIPPEL